VFALMIAFFCAHDSDFAKLASSVDRKQEVQKKGQDFFNTDFSPVFDKNSMRRRLFMDKGVPAEMLTLGDGYMQEQEVADEDRWKLW
jgi:hypothetical protein